MKLLTWGANSHGQLGLGFKCEQILNPTDVLQITDLKVENIVDIKGGAGHTIILDNTGSLYSCGLNSKGQLGTDVETYVFNKINLLDNYIFKQISCGWDYTAALTGNGQVFVWGSNAFGQLGLSKDIKYTNKPTILDIPNMKSVSCGLRHMAFVTTDGRVYVCGNGSKGQLGLENNENMKCVINIHLLKNLDNISHVSCGQHHTIALRNDGSVYVWGDNKFGQLGFNPMEFKQLVPTKLSLDFIPKDIFTGWTHSAILTQDGNLYNFGRNTYRQLGSDRICDWKPEKVNVDYVNKISVGSEHNLIVVGNKLFCWGWNEHGNCGTGDTNDVKVPTNILSDSCVTFVATGSGQSFCIVE